MSPAPTFRARRIRMQLSRLLLRPGALALTLVAASGICSPSLAQGRSAEDTRTIDSYRLTMPMLRKVLPAVYAPGAERCERQQERRDVATLSLAEMARTLERCAPVMQKLRQIGVPARDAALVLASLHSTGQAVARRSGNVRAVPPGSLRDNALLLEANDAELRRLINEGDQS
jgi:hypothetical protein